MDEKRFVISLFGLAVALIVGYVVYRFVAALTLAVFLYYSTRRVHHGLTRFRLPARIRAGVAISVVGIPLIGLVSYTIVLILIEARRFVTTYPIAETVGAEEAWIQGIAELSNPTVNGLILTYRSGEFDPLIDVVVTHASLLTTTITGLLLNVLIALIVTYYLLIDGYRIHDWLISFDEDAIVREYLEAADAELEAVLYGNLLTVIAIAILAICTYSAYNFVAPTPATVPYPALAGALTGVASLIPVVGMKIVYVPLAAMASTPIVMHGDLSALAFIVGFLVVVIVIVDTIPDIVLRPYFSGKATHVGLLLLAYVFGPIVFGFHGLFLAPIILVVALTFATTALPRLLGADPQPSVRSVGPEQRRLDEYQS